MYYYAQGCEAQCAAGRDHRCMHKRYKYYMQGWQQDVFSMAVDNALLTRVIISSILLGLCLQMAVGEYNIVLYRILPYY